MCGGPGDCGCGCGCGAGYCEDWVEEFILILMDIGRGCSVRKGFLLGRKEGGGLEREIAEFRFLSSYCYCCCCR